MLAGLVGGLALAAVAGARRTSTAYDRYREATGLGFMGGGPSWTPGAALPANHPEIPRAANMVVGLRPGTDVAEFASSRLDDY